MKEIAENLLLLQNLELGAERVAKGGAAPEELRQRIPAQVLQHYDRLRARGKKGIAYVRNGVCGQCHMQVAVGLLASLHRHDNIYRCENCGAYLLVVKEPPALELAPQSTKPARRGRPRKIPSHVT